jgi:hypothetical protein
MRKITALLVAVIALAPLSAGAQVQNTGAWAGNRQAKQKMMQRRKKADDKAYKNALKKIPNAHTQVDPWQGVR